MSSELFNSRIHQIYSQKDIGEAFSISFGEYNEPIVKLSYSFRIGISG